ncbi:hypothetical protein FQN60_002294, partial [Etheostoma spectabile]
CSDPRGLLKRLPKAPPLAGRRHRGTGRENNAQPTSLRNSLCGELWVSASLDFIRRWDPDVLLSGGAFQHERTKRLSQLLLVHYATKSQQEMQTANCHEDVILKCECPGVDNVDFFSVGWYKLSNQKKNGIVRKAKNNDTPQYYSFTRSPLPVFGEKHSLLLPAVTPEDSGTYECYISANVGSQNQNVKVNLTVHACATEADLTTITAVWNTTESEAACHKQAEDLPVMWSIVGYVAVIEAVRMRSSRQWH